ncbi:cytochrome P450 [Spongiibacter sp. KMU-166]|uniref:Cytochrome P450 n=1 Tax=Spongiibacter thalassae TaxID=2721624 RepID=A0ABX1G9M1_9GAMM|nr:cytochrome P450 [Spongiibacter thalassae]NKI15861.1 cytochrome P450 [Spongiibacter thalassae]
MTTINTQRNLVPQDYADRIVDPCAWAEPESMYEVFTWLRANQPLGKVEHEDFNPFWLATKFDDISEISRQNDKFNSAENSSVLTRKIVDQQIRHITAGSPHLSRNLVNMDPPEHLKYRSITQNWFMPKKVRELEARVKEIASSFADTMIANAPECDFVSDIALRYPLHVVMDILGVPEKDEPLMLKLTQELFGARDPDLARDSEKMADPAAAAEVIKKVLADFASYFNGIAEDRRATPRDDVATVVANALVDGEPIKPYELANYYTVLATAGHDTTSASTAGAIWALCQFPEQFEKVKKDPSLIPGLVDETFRWITPVKHFMRTANEDYQIRGQTIKAGDWVMLSYQSANFDEEKFSNPFEFRIDRQPNKHLAFGHGPHVCIGQHLAKLELRVLLEALLPRIKSLKFNGEVKFTKANFISGPKVLPIRFEIE